MKILIVSILCCIVFFVGCGVPQSEVNVIIEDCQSIKEKYKELEIQYNATKECHDVQLSERFKCERELYLHQSEVVQVIFLRDVNFISEVSRFVLSDKQVDEYNSNIYWFVINPNKYIDEGIKFVDYYCPDYKDY